MLLCSITLYIMCICRIIPYIFYAYILYILCIQNIMCYVVLTLLCVVLFCYFSISPLVCIFEVFCCISSNIWNLPVSIRPRPPSM